MAKVDDWQLNRSLVECNRYILEEKIGCDVTFEVGTKQKDNVSAHKMLLANRSSVFSTMFYGSFPDSDTIAIPDIEPDVFKEFLSYVYTDKISFKRSDVYALLYTADKYSIQNLKVECGRFIEQSITCDNAFAIMETAYNYGLQELFSSCNHFVVGKSSEMLMSDRKMKISMECLKSIISSDKLEENEFCIYKAVMAWAENECRRSQKSITSANKRSVLGEVLYKIRFPLINAKQFAKIAETGILTEEEQLDVFKFISCGASSSSKFNSKCRIPCEEICLLQDPQVMSSKPGDNSHYITQNFWNTLQKKQIRYATETMIIHASGNVQLKGIVLQTPNDFAGTISISYNDQRTEKSMSREEKQFLLYVIVSRETGKGHFVHIHFSNMVCISKAQTFELSATVSHRNNKPFSQRPHMLFQNNEQCFETIEEIPPEPKTLMTLDDYRGERWAENQRLIVGLSYKRSSC